VDGDVEDRLDALERCLGCIVEGVVRSLCDFGAFVDLGGLDGLIHISELSWQRIGHPGEVVAVNQPVQVVVLHVDRTARRVALSYKRLREDPWQAVGGRYHVGDLIEAVISHVVHFGAFARVPEGVEGLVHISELSESTFEHPQEVVHEGQSVRVRVLHIDPASRRLGLSLRQAH
jgi:small subunit ribosomal protein S1